MRDLIEDVSKIVFKFLTNRIVWLMIITVVLFFILAAELFYLQIVISDTFTIAPPVTSTVEQSIPAPRGNIYDRFGRPLSVNISAHVVTMDPSQTISNEALLELTRLFERAGEDFVNDFPMTDVWPYEFTMGGPTPEIRQRREYRWKDDMAVPYPETMTAAETFEWLREDFNIDPELSNEDARRIMNFRSMLVERRFRPQLFVIATDISLSTVAAIEEQNTFFTGVSIEMRTLREYPQGIYFSHMLGYTGIINAEELEANPDYAHDDIIGKVGLERWGERELRGQPGTQIVEINPSTGRRIRGSVPQITPPVPGNNIFLTLDIDMQRATYYILKEHLTEIAILKLQGGAPGEPRITHQQIFANLFRAGWIPIYEIMAADSETQPDAFALRRYILDRFPEATSLRSDRAQIVGLLVDGVNDGRISPAMMFTAMVDLGILSDYDDFSERARAGRASTNSLIIEKLRSAELTPQMLNTDPSTGSVVVVCVPTGAVLAAVAYPSYDNNRLANRIDASYFYRINVDDPTRPMTNRPFVEARAPGSTFKMITAAAGLETGVITPRTTIFDRVTFTRPGWDRPVRCWGSHGSINVAQAIAISCNYFFFETSMRLGNDRHSRINTLNRYMEFFGLNERTGVEIGELADTFNRDRVPNIMSSPSLKEFIYLSRDEFAPRSDWDWFDGNTVATAIGQGYNNYSAAMMARYIAQIANNGKRLPLFLVDRIKNYRGEVQHQTVPTPDELDMELSDSTWEAIQQGMLWTTEGHGTAFRQFRGRNFPIQVAGKTGTAQQVQGRLDHSSFGGYAPFDDPQIAVYVTIPFGTTRVMPASATQIAREVIYAFLVPETTVERPVALNAIMR